MRLILALAAALVLVGAGGIFVWQQAEIAQLRGQLAESAPLREGGLRRAVADTGGLSADERRFVLDQYQDVLTRLDLPPSKDARLRDLLARRIEVAMDAQDLAARAGFAPGSPEMTRAEIGAIGGVDRQIAGLLGSGDDQRFVWLTSGAPPAAAPAAPPVTVVVNVVNPPQEAPPVEEASPPPADDSAYTYAAAPIPDYSSYYPYYPYATVIAGRGYGYERPYGREQRFGAPGGGYRAPVFAGGGGRTYSRRVR